MDLDELLRRQGGVVSRAQALSCGIAPRTVDRRAAEQRWRVLFPGVYLVAGHRPSDETRIRSAWLWLGPAALVSGPAAAHWYGMLPSPGPVVDVTVPRNGARRARAGVRLHRRPVDPLDRHTLRGIALTGRARTVLETAVALEDGAAFLDRALQQKHVRFPELGVAHSRMLGTRGAGRASRLLVAAGDRADSQAERHLLRILRGSGISGWVVGHAFGRWRLDVAFPALRIAIEFDSWAWHVERERFVNDRAKQNALVAAGWTVLRFTWTDVVEHPARTRATIQQTLSRAA